MAERKTRGMARVRVHSYLSDRRWKPGDKDEHAQASITASYYSGWRKHRNPRYPHHPIDQEPSAWLNIDRGGLEISIHTDLAELRRLRDQINKVIGEAEAMIANPTLCDPDCYSCKP